MLRKCFELLGLVDPKKQKPMWLSSPGCGTLDGVVLFRLMSEKTKKKKGLLF